MNNSQMSFIDKLTTGLVNDRDVRTDTKSYSSAPFLESGKSVASDNPSEETEFINALENYLRKSRYDDYTYLPHWALWS